MFNIRGGAPHITKLATAFVTIGKKNFSSSARGRAFGINSYSDRVSNYNPDDMANIANARRFMDNCMRRGVKSGGEDSSSSSGNFKCEITKKNNNLNDIAVIHVNNSKTPKNSKLDRHEYLEEGYIKLENILEFIKNIKKNNSKITLILEKPTDNYNKEFTIIK